MRLHFYVIREINCSFLKVQIKIISSFRIIDISQLTIYYITTFPRSRVSEDWRILRVVITSGFISLSNEGPPVLLKRKISTIKAYYFVFERIRECGNKNRYTRFNSLKHSYSIESLMLAENIIGEIFSSFFLSGSIQLGYENITE
jgi:hypothetical protein